MGGRNLRLTDNTRQPEGANTPYDHPYPYLDPARRAHRALRRASAGSSAARRARLFLAIAVAFNFAMFWFSARLALKMSRRARSSRVRRPSCARTSSSWPGAPASPSPLYLIPSEQPNAFATGRNPEHSAVAVTEGLLAHMPREQVRGVIAHELAHIKNRDVLVSTIAAMIGAAISAIANLLQFSMLFGGGDDDESPLGFVGSLAAIIFAPIAAMLLQLAVSRQREYLADAPRRSCSARADRSPRRWRRSARGQAVPMQVNPATASLYIANPLVRRRGMTRCSRRIRRSRSGSGASASSTRPASTTGHATTPCRAARSERVVARTRRPDGNDGVAATQDALYGEIDLELSWSEAELPERERTKHVHRLHPYLGKFVPQLVEALLDRYVQPGGRVLDPFAGSGTTLVQSLESGYDASGVDIAGFNCLLMRVKTAPSQPRRPPSRPALGARAASAFGPTAAIQRRHRATSRDWFAPAPRTSCSTTDRSPSRSARPTCSASCSRAPPARRGGRRTSTSTSRGSRRSSPYWCHKHRRTCRPVAEARRFLLRYTLDTLDRIEAFAPSRAPSVAAVLHGDARSSS